MEKKVNTENGISDEDGKKFHGALFKVAKNFKTSKQTKQQKRKCSNNCITRKYYGCYS